MSMRVGAVIQRESVSQMSYTKSSDIGVTCIMSDHPRIVHTIGGTYYQL